MRSLLASPRRRRRLAWITTVLIVAGAVVTAGTLYSRSIDNISDAPVESAPAFVPDEEQAQSEITRATATRALDVAARFVNTAVRRENVGASWDLASPSLRAGLTRRLWTRGEIPIVPYPVDTARWQLDYTYAGNLGLQVAVFAKPGSKIKPAVFNMDLKQIGHGSHSRWVVDSWQPSPERAVPSAPTSAIGLPQIDATGERQLGAAWILVPLAVLSLIVLIPLSFALLQWYRGRRAQQAYLRTRAGA